MQTRSLILSALFASAPALATEPCLLTPGQPPAATGQQRVSPDNWLNPGYLRFGLSQVPRFMPGVRVQPATPAPARAAAATQIDLDRVTPFDPADDTRKPLRFLLDNRIDADGVQVLHRGRLVLDYRRSGFDPAQPRLLLEATRPVLAMLLARAAAEGRVAQEKSISRVIPQLADTRELAKLSLQRLIDGRTGLQWSASDSRQWQQEAGWTPGGNGAGVRAWLDARKQWPRSRGEDGLDLAGPEGELLLWATENAWKQPAPALLCSLQKSIRARDPAFWASDPAGTALADGLALSLGDFANLGQALLDARNQPGRRGLVPAGFVDTVATPANPDATTPAALRGLASDASWQYRIAHPGGRGHHMAIIGAYGTSLYVDFDHGTVIAVFASHAARHSPLLLASLRNVWDEIAPVGSSPAGRSRNAGTNQPAPPLGR